MILLPYGFFFFLRKKKKNGQDPARRRRRRKRWNRRRIKTRRGRIIQSSPSTYKLEKSENTPKSIRMFAKNP